MRVIGHHPQREDKTGPGRSLFSSNATVLGLHQFTRDIESQTIAARPVSRSLGAAREPLEDRLKLIGGNARSVIENTNLNLIVRSNAFGFHLDRRTLGGIFARVLEQVSQHDFEQSSVRPDQTILWGWMKDDVVVIVVPFRIDAVYEAAQKAGEGHGLHLHVQAASLKTGQLQNLLDDPAQTARLLVENPQHFLVRFDVSARFKQAQ